MMHFVCELQELQLLMKYWQERLRLQHWDVKLKIVRAADFSQESARGENNWEQSTAESVIHILDPADWPKDTPFEQDMEITLVHELLHLHFSPFDNTAKESQEKIMLERAIDHIAKALVEVRRRKGDKNGIR